MADEKRVVWVLGAGFSKPLGGPMLKDLLSLESRRDLLPNHPTKADPGAYWLYHYGRNFEHGWLNNSKPIGENLWEHAEDYLDKLDTAARNPQGALAARLIRVLNDGPKGFARPPEGVYQKLANESWKHLRFIADMARRYVAAECINFLNKAEPKAEQWEPYRNWVRALCPNDTVLTFNYDAVIETADEKELIFSVLEPADFRNTPADCPHLLKLHGSVNWSWDGKKIRSEKNDFAESAEPEKIVIATPGVSKSETVKGVLSGHWGMARKALSAADVVVFIGYRFPPTDAQARADLLGAIRDNEQPHLDLHTVLGPKRDPDTMRLQRLLETATSDRLHITPDREMYGGSRTCRITVEPLWAEDFLSLWRREQLYTPPPAWS